MKQTGVGLVILAMLLIFVSLLPGALDAAASAASDEVESQQVSDGGYYAGRVVISSGGVSGVVSASGRFQTQGSVGQGVTSVAVDNSVGFWWSIGSQNVETFPKVYLPIIIREMR